MDDHRGGFPIWMALGDFMASRFSQSTVPGVPSQSHHDDSTSSSSSSSAAAATTNDDADFANRRDSEAAIASSCGNYTGNAATSMAYLPQTVVLCELRHDAFEPAVPAGSSGSGLVSKWRPKDRVSFNFICELRHDAFEPAVPAGSSGSGLVSKWRPKDRMKTGCVALVLCLNISVDPPDVLKISPCARMECWIDPFSMAPQKALESIGKTLSSQYDSWQPKACYKCQLDLTVDEVKKLCTTSRRYAKSERVLFHYNGHVVPKSTPNGEIWVFNKSYTQYIPLAINELDSWLKTPSIYVFDCSAAGLIVNSFIELHKWSASNSSVSQRDCILLAACEAHETLPQSAEFLADVFTSCLTTPIKMALRWFCTRSLFCESLDYSLVDKIPGRPNDRKTLLGELNWIFTAVTNTIAWNVLPYDLFQRLFRQDLLVASLFQNFLLAE
ncbi:regulatory-associated protein of TOR 1-like [Cajanus cajan]|uniref:regulatory-associated protein of TOR 1-like n=1 Tax=Cajanus cajan TaxID=3821 RepID=UPI0010FB5D24|nr:regulatory-associated protein of TOR 1-like [Cajanus cajan]